MKDIQKPLEAGNLINLENKPEMEVHQQEKEKLELKHKLEEEERNKLRIASLERELEALQLKSKHELEALQLKSKHELEALQLKSKQIEALMRENKRMKELCARKSVENLLKNIPFMRTNEARKPHMISNKSAQGNATKNRLQQQIDQPPKNLKPKKLDHEPAQIENTYIPSELVENIVINVLDGKGDLISSMLAQEIASCGESDTLPHYNETSPQDYLSYVIKDVIVCCGFRGSCEVVKEATLFSLRPDLIVVLVDGRLFFVAEVKNPQVKDKSPAHLTVFNSEYVAGQTLDYLKALKQQGVDWPFALLSTYNESVIVRLPFDTAKYNAIIGRGSENANECPAKRHIAPRADLSHEPKPQNSPTKDAFYRELKTISAPQSPEKADEKDSDCDDLGNNNTASAKSGYDYKDRKVVYSQVFKHDDLYKVITLALESSRVSFLQSKERNSPLIPNEGEGLNCELCTLRENGFSYEVVGIKCVSFDKPPKLSIKKYHVICQIGQGGSGKTILCSSPSGEVFAVKLFLPQTSKGYLGEDREREDDDYLNSTKQDAENECKLWRNLEPRYKAYYSCIILNGLWAITMPFFPPLPVDKRLFALNHIKNKLKEVAKHGLYYNASDLRWRHFGCRWTGELMEITLLDLGSLGRTKITIGVQLKELLDRINSEAAQKAKPIIVK